MLKIIEFVCTANHGRSKPAKLIGGNYLVEIDADKEYKVTSSGTSVDDIQNNRVPVSSMIRIIGIGKQRALYSAYELKEIDQATRDGNGEVLRHFYNKAADRFKKEEHEHRTEALKHFGIEGVIEETQEQTIARPDTIAVFSMAESNNRQVLSIYEGSGYKPVIDVLSRFATGDKDAALPDVFGKSKAEYFKAVEVLLEHVPMAIDRLIN